MAETVQSYPGLYDLGSGRDVALADGNSISSTFLNTRDIYSPGDPDFLIFGPGSEVWILGYSIRASRPSPFPAPANPLGLELFLVGTYNTAPPFTTQDEQRLILPVYEGVHHFAGRARVETTSVQWVFANFTGDDLEVSFQFWGKAL